MPDRPRRLQLSAGLACLVLLGLLALGVEQGWGWLASVDHAGSRAAAWTSGEPWLRQPLLVVELAFGTVGITVLTTALAVSLWVKGHRRAAVYAVLVVAVTALVTTVLKVLLARERPPWQNPELLLLSQAFPSGHASSITALGVVVLVLVGMLVRRSGVRRLTALLVALVVAAVYADRILLGRHYPSDVVGGLLLGLGLALVGLVVQDPLPRSHARRSEPLPVAGPTTRDLAVVLNPSKVEDEQAFRALVTSMATAAGWSEPQWFLTTPQDSGTGQAEAAAVAGADLVVVCGGDGTVREVCAELAGTGVPVGIIPAGTGNLLARNLELPLYIRAAVDVALTGQDQAVDLVEVSGDDLEKTHFMVMAGMGFDAAIMEGVNDSIKARVGWPAYVLSALKTLMYPAVKVRISVDGGEPVETRARTIVVGNVGNLQAGMPLLPDARIDDGLLDVVLLHPRRFLSWIPLAARVLLRWRRVDDLVNRMTGRTVVIRTDVETPRQLDGDVITPGRELRMECLHGRVLVRVPR